MTSPPVVSLRSIPTKVVRRYRTPGGWSFAVVVIFDGASRGANIWLGMDSDGDPTNGERSRRGQKTSIATCGSLSAKRVKRPMKACWMP